MQHPSPVTSGEQPRVSRPTASHTADVFKANIRQREDVIRTVGQLAFVTSLLYTIFYYVAGSIPATLFTGAAAIAYLLTTIYASHIRISGFLAIVTGSIQLAGLGLLFLPPEAGTQIFLFLVPMFTVLIVEPEDQKFAHVLSAGAMVTLAYLEYNIDTYQPPFELALAPSKLGPMRAGSAFITVMFATLVFQRNYGDLRRTRQALQVAYQRSESLLLNVLPLSIAKRLKEGESPIADDIPSATVLFCDLVGFTAAASSQSARETVTMLSDLLARFDDAIARHEVEKIKTIGDSYMVASGVPVNRPDHALQMLHFALELLTIIDAFNAETSYHFEFRVGVHTGPVTAGVIGSQKFAYDLWGDTVNTASRMESNGIPGRVQVSRAIVDAVGDAFHFDARSPIQAKGKGELEAFLVTPPPAK